MKNKVKTIVFPWLISIGAIILVSAIAIGIKKTTVFQLPPMKNFGEIFQVQMILSFFLLFCLVMYSLNAKKEKYRFSWYNKCAAYLTIFIFIWSLIQSVDEYGFNLTTGLFCVAGTFILYLISLAYGASRGGKKWLGQFF